MDCQANGCFAGVVGFIYAGMGFGLSILTCIFWAALRRFLPDIAENPAPVPKISHGRRVIRVTTQRSDLKSRQSRSHSKQLGLRPPVPATLKKASETIGAGASTPALHPPTNNAQIRRAASLESLGRRHSLVLVAPVITINHVDCVDNMSIKAPTITIHPNKHSEESLIKSKPRSFTMAHPPSLLDLPRHRSSPPPETNRAGTAFRLVNLKPPWGIEKPKIHRSVSSPHLVEFMQKKGILERSQEKDQPVLSGKSCKRLLKQEKRPSSASSQNSSSSKFFSSLPKNVEKKRSQALRTQPYNAPYFVPPPVSVPFEEPRGDKVAKHRTTLPSERTEKTRRPSTAAHKIFLSKAEKI
ncbi:hypothetical protein AN958_06758 [Leucoagaricus sp. SymC.cos]|nr:hypothetical protein AN958_06758 [Leucoagaricus sp. SymC.cos]